MLILPTQTPEYACFDFDGVIAADNYTIQMSPGLYDDRYASLIKEGSSFPNKEVLSFARELKKAGSTVLVLSGTRYHDYARIIKPWLPVDQPVNIFDRALCERSKYFGADFRYIGEQLLKVEDPWRLLMIDDSSRVIDAAREASWQTILYDPKKSIQ